MRRRPEHASARTNGRAHLHGSMHCLKPSLGSTTAHFWLQHSLVVLQAAPFARSQKAAELLQIPWSQALSQHSSEDLQR